MTTVKLADEVLERMHAEATQALQNEAVEGAFLRRADVLAVQLLVTEARALREQMSRLWAALNNPGARAGGVDPVELVRALKDSHPQQVRLSEGARDMALDEVLAPWLESLLKLEADPPAFTWDATNRVAWTEAHKRLTAEVARVRALKAHPEAAPLMELLRLRERVKALEERLEEEDNLPRGKGGHTARNVLTGEVFHACAVEWSQAERTAPVPEGRLAFVRASWAPGAREAAGYAPWARAADGTWVPVEVLP